jgi:hypothetical protein
MIKSLNRFALTTILCLCCIQNVFSENKKDSILGNDDIFLTPKNHGVSGNIYWKRSIDNYFSSGMPFVRTKDSDYSYMVKHFDLFSREFESLTSMKLNIDSVSVRNEPLFLDKKDQWIRLETKWLADIMTAYGFIESGSSVDEQQTSMPLVTGITGRSSVLDLGLEAEVKHVGELNTNASSHADYKVKGSYALNKKWKSDLEFGWDLIGETQGAAETKAVSELSGQPSSLSASNNLSIFNTRVKCYPFRNLKLSLNYYYYAQKKARMSHYNSFNYKEENNSILARRAADGISEDSGRELNVSADLYTKYGFYSTLLAGWYNTDAGDQIQESSSDENVFEIRGEIVVSF